MGILDDLIYGYRDLYDAEGVLLPRRTKLRVLGDGVTAVDNPVTGQTELTLAGGSGPTAIVVDRAINLTAFFGMRTIGANSFEVVYMDPIALEDVPPLGVTLLVFDNRVSPVGLSATGWYEITASDVDGITLTRLADYQWGTAIEAGQETVCRQADQPLASWDAGPGADGPGVGVYEWVVTEGGAVGAMAPNPLIAIHPVVEAATVGHSHSLADAFSPGFMSAQQVVDLADLVATKPIVVYTSLPSSALVGLTIDDENTISGTGPFAPVGATALVVAPYSMGVANLSGWYIVTVSNGSTWTAVRMPGLEAGTYIPAGQVTICQRVMVGPPSVTCWTMPGDALVGDMSDKLTPLPAVATPLSSTTPAGIGATGSVGTALTVSRADHVHAHGAQSWDAGAGLAHPAATSVDPGFMTASQVVELAALTAATAVTGSRTDGSALASLLTALATAGIITDSTTA